jgi:hypothetical protein
MYPGTIFNWHDNSGFDVTTTSVANMNAPLLMQAFPASKGTEDLIEISGSDFDAMYGVMNFDRYGQAAIQAKNIIDAGGRLLAKRVVAEDSTLANVVLIANVVPGNNGVTVTWESRSITGCKTFKEVKAAAAELLSDGRYPLFVYTDNGRGVSGKAVRLTPDYATSRTVGTMFYNLNVYEGTKITETKVISVDPTVNYGGVAYRLDEYVNVQISGEVLSDAFEAYAQKLADELAIDLDVIRSYDIVYGYNCKGEAIQGFSLDYQSIDLDAETGVAFAEGDNGEFGDAPVGTEALANALAEVFNNDNEDHDEVYDVDQYKVAAICDANYPDVVKSAIFNWVTFRKDCFYFRDFGTGLKTYAEIFGRYNDFANERNYFVGDYSTSYNITDPVSKKVINVTMMYDFAALLVERLDVNPFAPLAGTANGCILPSAIKGTINFTPVNTPKGNQKQAMDDIRVNYAIFEDDDCIVQSCYTSQMENTQLSWSCNVLGIQTVLRAVRAACPRQRYSLSTNSDLSAYADAVNKVLTNFTANFSKLNFIYTEDPLRTRQKIFYASIEFAFLGWAQTEIFDIYAINE